MIQINNLSEDKNAIKKQEDLSTNITLGQKNLIRNLLKYIEEGENRIPKKKICKA